MNTAHRMDPVSGEGYGTSAVQAVENASDQVARARASMAEADRQLRHFVHERPLTALAGAVIAGYLIARITRLA